MTRLTKRLMLMEEEGRVLHVKMEEEQAELRTLRSRMKEAVTWEEHCGITGKLHRYTHAHAHTHIYSTYTCAVENDHGNVTTAPWV